MPHAARLAERPAAGYAERQRALQPVPQPEFRGYGAWRGRRIVGQHTVHDLPHLHSWFEHEWGVSEVTKHCRAVQRMTRQAFRPVFTRGLKDSKSATELFSK